MGRRSRRDRGRARGDRRRGRGRPASTWRGRTRRRRCSPPRARPSGHVDVLVCNHASSGPDGALSELTAEMLDAHCAVNLRATLLSRGLPGLTLAGRGQDHLPYLRPGLGPMPGELAYAATKAASPSPARSRRKSPPRASRSTPSIQGRRIPAGGRRPQGQDPERAPRPDRVAGGCCSPDRLAGESDDGAWITGQVINSEGGFRRWAAAQRGEAWEVGTSTERAVPVASSQE